MKDKKSRSPCEVQINMNSAEINKKGQEMNIEAMKKRHVFEQIKIQKGMYF